MAVIDWAMVSAPFDHETAHRLNLETTSCPHILDPIAHYRLEDVKCLFTCAVPGIGYLDR